MGAGLQKSLETGDELNAEVHAFGVLTILGFLFSSGPGARSRGRRAVPEVDGDHPHGVGVLLAGHGGGDLRSQRWARTKVVWNLGPSGISAPGDTVGVSAGAAQHGSRRWSPAKGLGRRDQGLDGMMDVIKELVGGDAMVRKPSGRPQDQSRNCWPHVDSKPVTVRRPRHSKELSASVSARWLTRTWGWMGSPSRQSCSRKGDGGVPPAEF